MTPNTDLIDYVWGKLFADIDVTRGLEKFDCPVFLALGRYDFGTPPSSWDDIRPRFKNLTIRMFEESGHYPQLEEPELFDQDLIRWMQETS